MKRMWSAAFLLAAVLVGAGPACAKEPDAAPPAPVRVRFELPRGKQDAKQKVPVTIVVEPSAAAQGASGDWQMELLLRLPPGVEMASPGWTEKKLSRDERKDPSGSWTVLEKKARVPPAPDPSGALVREPLFLSVTREGTNWVLSVRVKGAAPAGPWQTFGAAFASRQGESVEFHDTPQK